MIGVEKREKRLFQIERGKKNMGLAPPGEEAKGTTEVVDSMGNHSCSKRGKGFLPSKLRQKQKRTDGGLVSSWC